MIERTAGCLWLKAIQLEYFLIWYSKNSINALWQILPFFLLSFDRIWKFYFRKRSSEKYHQFICLIIFICTRPSVLQLYCVIIACRKQLTFIVWTMVTTMTKKWIGCSKIRTSKIKQQHDKYSVLHLRRQVISSYFNQ